MGLAPRGEEVEFHVPAVFEQREIAYTYSLYARQKYRVRKL